MKKVALFAKNSDPLVFAHAMLNALDFSEKGYAVTLIIEADATKQVSLLRNETKPFADLWRRVKGTSISICVCRACARRNTVEPACVEQNLELCGEPGMDGHAGIETYLAQGYQVLIF